ncbi:regulatory protein [Pelagirhabdus alkalitolerans]|uniref:Regulatory protein RecX n=1 Tax=Pelagirhabdus alkalitolerans TaxID=1612202 RepID=A0A1G6IFD3_9BACI|nr:recombination regulator RecX [Pelagirhabdus alkalitolerans]SDC05103.1 regulatory protein [Pelagirhabdus alkalitolerans]
MPTISKISIQKKNKQRYNIHLIDQEKEYYGFSVEEDTLIQEGLQKGVQLTQDEIESLLRKDSVHKGYSKALNYLSHRMRSVYEMRTYLKDKEIDEEEINHIVERLLNDQLLDDKAFSQAYVLTKINTTMKGPNMIRKELIQKGVDQLIINQALEAFDDQQQLQHIEKWLAKQSLHSKKESLKQMMQKQKQTLMRKGYDQHVINLAFERLVEEREDSSNDEWDALVYQGEKLLKRYRKKHEGYMLTQKLKAGLYQKGFTQDLINRFMDEHDTHQV